MAQPDDPKKKPARSWSPAVYAGLFVGLVVVALTVEGLTIQQVGFGPLSVTFGKGAESSPTPVAQILPSPESSEPSTSPSASPGLSGNQQSLMNMVTSPGGLSLASDECAAQPSGQEQLAALSCTVPVDSGQVAVQVFQFETTTAMNAWIRGQAGNVPNPDPSASCWSTSGFAGFPSNSDNAEEACYQDQQGVFWVARTFPATDVGVLTSSGDTARMTELRTWWDSNPLIIDQSAAAQSN